MIRLLTGSWRRALNNNWKMLFYKKIHSVDVIHIFPSVETRCHQYDCYQLSSSLLGEHCLGLSPSDSSKQRGSNSSELLYQPTSSQWSPPNSMPIYVDVIFGTFSFPGPANVSNIPWVLHPSPGEPKLSCLVSRPCHGSSLSSTFQQQQPYNFSSLSSHPWPY